MIKIANQPKVRREILAKIEKHLRLADEADQPSILDPAPQIPVALMLACGVAVVEGTLAVVLGVLWLFGYIIL